MNHRNTGRGTTSLLNSPSLFPLYVALIKVKLIMLRFQMVTKNLSKTNVDSAL